MLAYNIINLQSYTDGESKVKKMCSQFNGPSGHTVFVRLEIGTMAKVLLDHQPIYVLQVLISNNIKSKCKLLSRHTRNMSNPLILGRMTCMCTITCHTFFTETQFKTLN